MYVERLQDVESLEELEERRFEELLREEMGDAALDRLIERLGDRERPAHESQPFEIEQDEFVSRPCQLIFCRSCLADEAHSLCVDCSALAAADGLPRHDIPHVDRVHRSCPACGALVMLPEREEVSCGFVCPSCRVHLSVRGGRLHLFWNHREAVREGVEP